MHTNTEALPAGVARKVIHVNQHVIRANTKNGEDNPTITIKYKGQTYTAHGVVIGGPCIIRTDGNQLSCGARVWIETDHAVTLEHR